MKPGNNSVSLRGTLDIHTVLDNIPYIVSSQRSALEDGDLELSVSGNSTVYNGQHIEYYEKVLNNLTLTARVPILEVLAGTLQGLLSSNDSPLGRAIQNITNALGSSSNLTEISSIAQSLRALV